MRQSRANMTRPLIFSALFFSSLSALAQTPPPPPPPSAYAADAPVEREEEGRIRWGVNAQLGVFLPQTAVMFGAQGRVGYQFSSLLAVYGDIGADVGIGIGGSVSPSGATSASINIVTYWKLAALAELTLGDHFNVAAGPLIASGAWAGISAAASNSGATQSTVVAGGWMPGVDARLGFGFGSKNPHTGRRSGFNIGLDFVVLFSPNSLYTHTEAGAGGASVEVQNSGLAVGFVPTLTLGYDAR
jgi:hypothetical protein